jgi:hypothetical protein
VDPKHFGEDMFVTIDTRLTGKDHVIIPPNSPSPGVVVALIHENGAPIELIQALGLVPEHVFHTQEQFHQCPKCRQVFWPGSHLRGILARVLDKLD